MHRECRCSGNYRNHIPYDAPHDYLTTWNAFDLRHVRIFWIHRLVASNFTNLLSYKGICANPIRISLIVTNSVITMSFLIIRICSGRSCSIRTTLWILGCYRIATTTGDVVDLVDSHITQTVAMLTTVCRTAPHTITVRAYCRQLHNLNGAMSLPSQVLQATFSRAPYTALTLVWFAYKPQRWLLPRFL
jgi:hypothetical protein